MSAESEITLTVEQFRADFPEFTDPPYTDAIVQAAIDRSACFISKTNSGPLKDECRLLAIEYMAAHLLKVCGGASGGNGGSQGGLVGSSSIGSVSVSMVPPPGSSSFTYWINQTCYGQAYLALLQTKAPAGLYCGGSFTRVLR